MKSNRRRALRAGMAVLVVATVSLAGASINEWWRALPPPERCSGEDLVRWMATRDLTEESAATRRALVERLAIQLCEGVEADRIDDYLNNTQKRRFASNARLLMRTWFEDAASKYAAMDVNAKAQFLDEQIALVEEWDLEALAESLSSGEPLPSSEGNASAGTAGVPGSLAMLNAEINRWIDGAQGAERERLQAFASAIRIRLLARAFQPFTSTFSTSSS